MDWLVVGLLVAAMFASFLNRFALPPLIKPVRLDLPLSVKAVLLADVAVGCFHAIMGLTPGWLADG